jgi:hypothetical protein
MDQVNKDLQLLGDVFFHEVTEAQYNELQEVYEALQYASHSYDNDAIHYGEV